MAIYGSYGTSKKEAARSSPSFRWPKASASRAAALAWKLPWRPIFRDPKYLTRGDDGDEGIAKCMVNVHLVHQNEWRIEYIYIISNLNTWKKFFTISKWVTMGHLPTPGKSAELEAQCAQRHVVQPNGGNTNEAAMENWAPTSSAPIPWAWPSWCDKTI